MQKLEQVTREVVNWLTERRIGYALIGGLAVSFRTIERFTKDIDLVIAVEQPTTVLNRNQPKRFFIQKGLS